MCASLLALEPAVGRSEAVSAFIHMADVLALFRGRALGAIIAQGTMITGLGLHYLAKSPLSKYTGIDRAQGVKGQQPGAPVLKRTWQNIATIHHLGGFGLHGGAGLGAEVATPAATLPA